MVKRGADTELNKDNWAEVTNRTDNDANGDAAASSTRAPDAVLQARRIVKARRPVRTAAAPINDSSAGASSNPFANVMLVAPVAKPKEGGEAATSNDDAKAPGETSEANAAPDASSSKDANESKSPEAGGDAATTKPIFGSTTSYSGFAQVKSGTSGGASTTGFSFGTAAPTTTAFGSAPAPSSFVFGAPTTAAAASTISALPKFDFAAAAAKAERAASPAPAASAVTLPETYKVESGEENEECILEAKCKSYKFDWTTPIAKDASDEATFDGATASAEDTATRTKSWKETGIGMLRVLRNQQDESSSASLRVVQRQTSTHHVLVNAVLDTVQRRPATHVFDVNGTLALKFNPANAAEFERLVVQPYFSSSETTKNAPANPKEAAPVVDKESTEAKTSDAGADGYGAEKEESTGATETK